MTIKYGAIVSASEYLKVEESAPTKSEYVAGRMFAMSGANVRHDRIVINLTLLLGPLAKKHQCDIFNSDVKLKIESLSAYYYPDLMFSCERADDKVAFVTMPCFVVEVLSPSTEIIDRREKLLAYRSVASIREYLLVSQEAKFVELYRKDGANDWQRFEFQNEDIVILTALPGGALPLSLGEIYLLAPKSLVLQDEDERRDRMAVSPASFVAEYIV